MMRKKVKNIICLMLAFVMMTSIVGCQSKEETKQRADYQFNQTGYPIVDEPITLKVAVANASTDKVNETELVKYIKEEFGIILECVPYTGGDWSTEFTLMLASDNLPDLIINASTSVSAINEYGMDDYFLPINDYLDLAPNMKSYFDEYPEYETMCTAEDGNIYGLTTIDQNIYNRVNRCFIDQRWLTNVGMEMPETVDELYEVLKAFKEQDANGNGDPNDEIPISDIGGYQRSFVPILNAFGMPTNNMTSGRCLDEDGKLYFPYVTDNYRAYLEYMNKLYEEELIDQSVFTRTYENLCELASNNQVGMYGCAAPYVYAKQDVNYDANFNAVFGLTSDYCDEPYVVMDSATDSTVTAVISANTQYPEACVRLLDYFYTDRGILDAALGVEGVTYDMVEKSYAPGVKVQQMRQPEGYSSAEVYRYQKATISDGFAFVLSVKGDQPELVMAASDEVLYGDEMVADFGWYVLLERRMRQIDVVDAVPKLSYTKQEGKDKSTITTDISTYIKQITTQFITGKMDITDSNWNSYVKTVKQMGLEDWLKIEQTAYERMMEK